MKSRRRDPHRRLLLVFVAVLSEVLEADLCDAVPDEVPYDVAIDRSWCSDNVAAMPSCVLKQASTVKHGPAAISPNLGALARFGADCQTRKAADADGEGRGYRYVAAGGAKAVSGRMMQLCWTGAATAWLPRSIKVTGAPSAKRPSSPPPPGERWQAFRP